MENILKETDIKELNQENMEKAVGGQLQTLGDILLICSEEDHKEISAMLDYCTAAMREVATCRKPFTYFTEAEKEKDALLKRMIRKYSGNSAA